MTFRINQKLSLMIPRVFPQWIDEQKFIDIFHEQRIGRVYKVSIIRMPDSKKRSFPIYQAFVYFSAWYDNEIAYNFQQRIFGPKKQARVVYDDPWFWVVFENKKHRLSNNDKRLIRLGYQAYIHEQELVEQDNRIRLLENEKIERTLNLLPNVPAERAPMPAERAPMPNRPVPARPASAKFEPHLNWPLTEAFVMDTLGEEITLTETAINVAEAALAGDIEMDVSDNYITPPAFNYITPPVFNYVPETSEWYNSSWSSFYENQLAIAAAEVLGTELALTETAISVAEAALKDEYNDYFQEEKMDLDCPDVDDYYTDSFHESDYDRYDSN